MITVGYSNRTRYWQIYAFNNPPEGYQYKRAIDIPFHLLGAKSQFLLNTKWMVPFQGCDLYHTYNGIVPGNSTPWVVEVESLIPRYGQLKEGDKRFDWGLEKLKSDSCKAIIFTSEYTREMNSENFKKWGIDLNICHTVYRAVETYEPLERTGQEKEFTILFVGNGFYRKGGIELLKAFKKFSRKDARLVIISSFEVDWEIYPTENEIRFVQNEIEKNEQIEAYQNLSHSEVIDWMRKSDVFVNTTYSDAFNNSILEALSCGVPVIVTDMRAIPEFVKENYNGFMITPDMNNREKMVEHIHQKLVDYYSDTKLLEQHSKNARKFVGNKFLIEHRIQNLKEIYDKAMY